MLKLTDAQKRLLLGLHRAGPIGGVFDRYVRVVANGEVLTTHGSTTALNAFRRRYIEMKGSGDEDRVVLSYRGQRLLEQLELI